MGFYSLIQASGIGTLVAGCFTANRLITILQTVVPVTTPSELINAVNPNVITYTQASAGLAIGIGLLSIFLLCSIVLRIGKFKAGKVGKGFLLVVSYTEVHVETLLCTSLKLITLLPRIF